MSSTSTPSSRLRPARRSGLDELTHAWAQLARGTGALAALPLALSLRSWLEVLQGRLGSATSHLAEIEDMCRSPAPRAARLTRSRGGAARRVARRRGGHTVRCSPRDARRARARPGHRRRPRLRRSPFSSSAPAGMTPPCARHGASSTTTASASLARWPISSRPLPDAPRWASPDRHWNASRNEPPPPGRLGRPGSLAAQALLHTGDDADECFRLALEDLSRTAMATDTARTQLLHGEWLRRARRRKEAREPLHEALDFFESIGASGSPHVPGPSSPRPVSTCGAARRP